MSHRFPDEGIRVRGRMYRDEDQAYDHFRQRQDDEAGDAAAAAHHQEDQLQQQLVNEGEDHGSANPES